MLISLTQVHGCLAGFVKLLRAYRHDTSVVQPSDIGERFHSNHEPIGADVVGEQYEATTLIGCDATSKHIVTAQHGADASLSWSEPVTCQDKKDGMVSGDSGLEMRLDALIEQVLTRIEQAVPWKVEGGLPMLLPWPELWAQVWIMLPFTAQARVRGACRAAITWAQSPTEWHEMLLSTLVEAQKQALETRSRACFAHHASANVLCVGGSQRRDDDISHFVFQHAQRSRTLDDVLGTMMRRRQATQHRTLLKAEQVRRVFDGQELAKKLAQMRQRAEPDSEATSEPEPVSEAPPLWTGKTVTYQAYGGCPEISISGLAPPRSRASTDELHMRDLRNIATKTVALPPSHARWSVTSKPYPTCNVNVAMRSLTEPSLRGAIPAAAAILHRTSTRNAYRE